MWVHVVKEYQRWAGRGYLVKYVCPEHSYLELIVSCDPKGIFLLCPFGDHKHYLSQSEYNDVESKLKVAKMIFREQ